MFLTDSDSDYNLWRSFTDVFCEDTSMIGSILRCHKDRIVCAIPDMHMFLNCVHFPFHNALTSLIFPRRSPSPLADCSFYFRNANNPGGMIPPPVPFKAAAPLPWWFSTPVDPWPLSELPVKAGERNKVSILRQCIGMLTLISV